MAISAKKVLESIAASPAAMAVLDSSACAVEAARPPKLHADGNLRGTLVMRDEHTPEDPGSPGRTLGDLLRDALGQERADG